MVAWSKIISQSTLPQSGNEGINSLAVELRLVTSISSYVTSDRYSLSACFHAAQTISSSLWDALRFGAAWPLLLSDSRCTFRFRGLAQDCRQLYLLRVPLNSQSLLVGLLQKGAGMLTRGSRGTANRDNLPDGRKCVGADGRVETRQRASL